MIRTIQERNNALIDRLNDMVRESPISGGFGLLGQILVDQGLADTRAGSIDDACNYETDVDYDDLISAINHCEMYKNITLQMYDATDNDCVSGLLLVIKACEDRLKDAYINYGEPMTKEQVTMLGCMVVALDQSKDEILEEIQEGKDNE